MDDSSMSVWDWLIRTSKRPSLRRAMIGSAAVLLAGLGAGVVAVQGWTNGDGIVLLATAIVCAVAAARYPVPAEEQSILPLFSPAAAAPESQSPLETIPEVETQRTGCITSTAVLLYSLFSSRYMRFTLAVGFALWAQWFKDVHPLGMDESQPYGWLLYSIAAGLALWAMLAGDLPFPLRPGGGDQTIGTLPKWEGVQYMCLGSAVVFSLLAFVSFSDLFQPLPLIFLAFAAGYWILAAGDFVWKDRLELRRALVGWGGRLQRWMRSLGADFTISPWSMLCMAVVLALCVLRTYRMGAIPPEMTSDHAEKLLDVSRIFAGKTYIFFANNGGREPLEFYLIALVEAVFGTGTTFLSLQIVSVADGLITLPFIYLIGKELAGRRAGLLAMLLVGFGYWPDLISRIGLRFPLSPLFSAMTLYFFLRALRRKEWNGFLWAGLALGVGLYGYTPIRILALTLMLATGLFLLFPSAKGSRRWALAGLGVTLVTAGILFIPMLKYAVLDPNNFWLRTVTRIAPTADSVTDPVGTFFANVSMALRMFSENDGVGWFNLVPLRPALDIVTGAFFHLGAVLAIAFALRRRSWESAFLTLSVPVLLLPSILALALPSENPSLTRGSAAIPVVFFLAAFALLLFADNLRAWFPSRGGWLAGAAVVGLLAVACAQDLNLTLVQYPEEYSQNCQNASELGEFIKDFAKIGYPLDDMHTIPYPYWVDGRLVSMYAGAPTHDFEIQPQDISTYPQNGRMTFFLLLAQDAESFQALQTRFPQGNGETITSRYPGKDFIVFFVPPTRE